jgi:hypothetical protein
MPVMTVRDRELDALREALVQARGELAGDREWIRDARRSLLWLVEFGAFGGTFAQHLRALVERCPLPEEDDDDRG